MRQFVSHDRGVLGLGLRIQKQATVDPDNPSGCGEGVDLRAVEQNELQAAILQLTGFAQAIDAGFDEVLELRIVELADLAAYQAQPGAAQLVFLLRRNDGGTGIAKEGRSLAMAGAASRQASVNRVGRRRLMHKARVEQRRYCSWLAAVLARVVRPWVSLRPSWSGSMTDMQWRAEDFDAQLDACGLELPATFTQGQAGAKSFGQWRCAQD